MAGKTDKTGGEKFDKSASHDKKREGDKTMQDQELLAEMARAWRASGGMTRPRGSRERVREFRGIGKTKFQWSESTTESKTRTFDDMAQAQVLRDKITAGQDLEARTRIVVMAIKATKEGTITREALGLGIQGFVQELEKAKQILDTEAARARRTRK